MPQCNQSGLPGSDLAGRGGQQPEQLRSSGDSAEQGFGWGPQDETCLFQAWAATSLCSSSLNVLRKAEDHTVKEDLDGDDDDEDDKEESEDKAIDVEAVSSLRDFKYNLQVLLQEKARGLTLRPLTLLFEDSTIYGMRAGSHDAWLVTSGSCGSAMAKKSLFKRLVVDKIPMLPRNASCLICFTFIVTVCCCMFGDVFCCRTW